LVELLAALAIVGVLVALGSSVLFSSQALGEKAECLSNLRQIGVATQLYVAENNNRLPPVGDNTTWFFILNRYLQQTNAPSGKLSPCFSCPTFLRETAGQYSSTAWDRHGYGFSTVMVGSPRTSWGWQAPPNTLQTYQPLMTEIRDPSRTILVGDTVGPAWLWHSQNVSTFLNRTGPRGAKRHNGSINVLFVDGHAKAVTPEALVPLLP
jgi:prepilin-type processing-associated H-X9-DG protein